MSRQASFEETNASSVVRFLLKLERAAVLHELAELNGMSAAQLLQRRLNLLFLNVVVLFVLAAPGEALPRQSSLDEVQQDVADSLQVVSSGLLNSLVRGDGGIPSRACQILAVLVGNVLALAVLVALGQTEIDNVDVVTRGLRTTNQEIIRLNVSMADAFAMQSSNS